MSGFPNVPVMPAMDQKQAPLKGWLEGFRRVVNNMMRGKTNNFGSITLTANASTTTLSDPNIGGSSVILLAPTTAHAQAISTPYASSMASGSCTLNHANDANTDKTFNYVIVG